MPSPHLVICCSVSRFTALPEGGGMIRSLSPFYVMSCFPQRSLPPGRTPTPRTSGLWAACCTRWRPVGRPSSPPACLSSCSRSSAPPSTRFRWRSAGPFRCAHNGSIQPAMSDASIASSGTIAYSLFMAPPLDCCPLHSRGEGDYVGSPNSSALVAPKTRVPSPVPPSAISLVWKLCIFRGGASYCRVG